MILRAERLTKYYGEFRALHEVSLGVAAGEFVSIIGPNGAGKSTLINLLTGLARPTTGTVRFKERDITGIGPVRLAKLGMARSFQLVQIFPELTVLETLQAAVVARLGRGRRLPDAGLGAFLTARQDRKHAPRHDATAPEIHPDKYEGTQPQQYPA